MGKKITTLNLDEDDLRELHRRGFGSVSEVCRRAIRAMLGDYFDDIEVYMKMTLLTEERDIIEEDLFNLNRRINNLISRKSALDIELAKLDSHHKVTLKTVNISQNIKLLNPIVIDCKFDEELTKLHAPEIIADIYKVNPNFDLSAHINRMKEILTG